MDYDKAKAELALQAEVDAMVDELVRLDMDRAERILQRIAVDTARWNEEHSRD